MDMVGTFPLTRLRRLRKEAWCRDLVAESHVTLENLVQPLFISEMPCHDETPPGFYTVTYEEMFSFVETHMLAYGLSKLALFPVLAVDKKDASGSEAFRQDNFFLKAMASLKKRFPEVTLIVDVALDPFTDHGHDGVVEQGDVANDKTAHMLAALSCLYAQAGADVVAPSDMMDGRVGIIRQALDRQGYEGTKILSYAVKYASHFYGPFRQVMKGPSSKNFSKASYQMDVRNVHEAMREAALDIQEGADFLMVKPGLLSLDILAHLKKSTAVPLFAYHVSGEYVMLRTAAEKGFIDYEQGLWEIVSVLRRAGASGIVTYGASDAARFMQMMAAG